MKRLAIVTLVLFTVLTLFVGCNATKSISAETVVLSQNEIELTVGETATLTYTVLPNNADYSLSWSSLNTSVATVTNGKITAIGVGQANIVVSDKNWASAICSVKVKQKSAYDRLTKDERDFVDTFLKAINSFKNPASVYVEEIQYTVNSSSWNILGKWQVYLTAQNGFGGNSAGLYCLSENGSISKAPLQWKPTGDTKYDVEKINAAIQEKMNKY